MISSFYRENRIVPSGNSCISFHLINLLSLLNSDLYINHKHEQEKETIKILINRKDRATCKHIYIYIHICARKIN